MEAVLGWIGQHPELALLFLFLACAVEALFVIGIIIPGALILFGTGALIALGTLDFGTCVLLASAGAFVGDTLTFWIGRRTGRSLFRMPWLARRPELTQRGQRFFERHGGKSIMIGRYIGPLRPLMPAIAGAYAMPWRSFVLIDVIAALSWSVTYLAPGVVFGASLNLAAEVATHMVILLCAVVALVWLALWLAGRCVALGQRYGERWVHRLLDWSARHRRLGRLGSWLADPDQPETLGLLLIAVILLAAAWLVLFLAWGIGSPYPAPYDALAHQVLRDFYTPGAAFVASAIGMLGEARVYLPVAIAALLTLVFQRRLHAAAHWLAAVGFAAVIALGLYYLRPLPDPIDFFAGHAVSRFSGRDLILSTTIYGFIPVLLSTRRPASVRAWIYGLSTALLLLIAVSQVYTGLQWASVAAFSVVLGLIWVACLALGYRRHRARHIPARPFLWVTLGTFVLAALLAWHGSLDARLARAQPRQVSVTVSEDDWWLRRHAELPSHRIGIAGRPEQPLNLQWVGGLDAIRELLRLSGWQEPTPLNWRTALRWLSSRAPFESLPLLPQIHAGQYPALVMVRPLSEVRLEVIRLWPSGWQVDRRPLWIGAIGMLEPNTTLPLLRFPSARAAPLPRDGLLADGLPVAQRRVAHPTTERLLVRPRQ